MRTVDTHLLEDKMDEAVTHYINSHHPNEPVHIDSNGIPMTVQDDGGGRVTIMHQQTYTTQMCRQVSVTEQVGEGPWGEELLEGPIAAIVAHLQSSRHHPSSHHKVSQARSDTVDSSVILDGTMRFNGQNLDQQSEPIVVQLPSMQTLPPLQDMKRCDTDWFTDKNKKDEQSMLQDSGRQVLELASSSPAQHKQQSRKSLPHKKRISRKLKRNNGNSTPQQEQLVVINCSEAVPVSTEQEQILPDNYVAVPHSTHMPHEVRAVLVCQECGEYYGEEQVKFYHHLRAHYEPHHTIIIENPVNDLPIDKISSNCIVDNVATLPDSIVELSLESTVPKTLYQPIEKHILYSTGDKTLSYNSNKLQYSMASMDAPAPSTDDKFRKQRHETQQRDSHANNTKLEDMGEFSEPEDLMAGIQVCVPEAYEPTILPHLTVDNGHVTQDHARHWYSRSAGGAGAGAGGGACDAYCGVCAREPDTPYKLLKEEVLQRILDTEVSESANFADNMMADHEVNDPEDEHNPEHGDQTHGHSDQTHGHSEHRHNEHAHSHSSHEQIQHDHGHGLNDHSRGLNDHGQIQNDHSNGQDNDRRNETHIQHVQNDHADALHSEHSQNSQDHSESHDHGQDIDHGLGQNNWQLQGLSHDQMENSEHSQPHSEHSASPEKEVIISTYGFEKIKRHRCSKCDRAFSHRNSLIYHLLSHKGKQHKCRECNKSFLTRSALKIHGRTHADIRPYKCEACGRQFRQWSDLKYHRNSIHSDKKNFKCEVCGKEFARKYSLSLHSKVHTGEKNFKCELCNKSFRCSSYKIAHMRTHTNDRPFKCAECNKGFRSTFDLRRHTTIHEKYRNKPLEQKPKIKHLKHNFTTIDTKEGKVQILSEQIEIIPKYDLINEQETSPKKKVALASTTRQAVLMKKQTKPKKANKKGAPNVTVQSRDVFKANEDIAYNVDVYDKEYAKVKQVYDEKAPTIFKEEIPSRQLAVLRPLGSHRAETADEKIPYRAENTDGKMQVFTNVEKTVANQVDFRHLERDSRDVRSDLPEEPGFIERLTAMYSISSG